jgi:hypothetical protein
MPFSVGEVGKDSGHTKGEGVGCFRPEMSVGSLIG